MKRACALAITLALVGCGAKPEGGPGGSGGSSAKGGSGGADSTGGAGPAGGADGVGGTGGEAAAPFQLWSTAFAEGETVPLAYECGPPITVSGPGDNLSPPLAWTPGPPQTQSYAIVMRDLDAANTIHWVIYDIPAEIGSLPEGIPNVYMPTDPAGAKQAELFGAVHACIGPCSPGSVNTCQWTVHALDVPALPDAHVGTPESSVAPLVESLSIASASLSGES